MAYYVMVKNKNSYDTINITKSRLFTRLSNFSKTGACSLKEIDYFTMNFNSEVDLKNFLFSQGLINEQQYIKEFSIRNLNNGEFNKVMYDLIYQDAAEYMVPDILEREIFSRRNDFEFLWAFYKRFYNYYDMRKFVPDFAVYLHDSERTGFRSKYLDETLHEMISSLLYGQKYSERKVQYANQHMMIAFLIHYDKKKLEAKNKMEKEENISLKDYISQIEVKPNAEDCSLFEEDENGQFVFQEIEEARMIKPRIRTKSKKSAYYEDINKQLNLFED